MKQYILSTLDQLKNDRPLLLIVVGLLVLSVSYTIFVLTMLKPTDLQVATRYTAFGGVQYYRDQWFYLITFIGLGVFTPIIQIGIILKIYARNMRSLSLGFGLLCIFISIITFLITKSVFGIAYLS